jgi:hypothetical protein
MSISKKVSVIIVTLLFLSFSTPEVVQAIPVLPSSFHGTVKVNKTNVEDGTLIEAIINGQVFAHGYTQVYNGDSVYVVNIPGDDSSSATVDGGNEGDIVSFTIGGIQAAQTGIWHAGTSVDLNLKITSTTTINTPAPTPTPYPTQTAITIIQNPEVTQTSEITKPIVEASLTPKSVTSTVQSQDVTLSSSNTVQSPKLSVQNTQSIPDPNIDDQSEKNSTNLIIFIILFSFIIFAFLVFMFITRIKRK